MNNLEKLQELKLKTEGMLSGLFLKNIELLSEYNIDMTKLSEAGLFYIGLANKLLEKNIVVADELSIANEVELLNLQDTYNLYGGYTTVKELIPILSKLPQDYKVTCCGAENYLYLCANDKYITIDCEHYWG